MAYSKEDRDRAFIAYKELGSTARASKACDIPETTLAKWRDKYAWARLVRNEEKALIESNYDLTPYVENICKQFNIDENDGEVLVQVKTIEKICLATIKGETEVLELEALRPPNFDSAIRALKICWETRDKIFPKNVKGSAAGTTKVNYIGQLHQHYNKGDSGIADNTIPTNTGTVMVSEQAEDLERITD